MTVNVDSSAFTGTSGNIRNNTAYNADVTSATELTSSKLLFDARLSTILKIELFTICLSASKWPY